MLHAKALVMDRDVLSVGTANIDNRSFRLNFELSLFLANGQLNAELAAWLEDLFAHSEEITSKLLDEKSTPRKLLESAAHLLSPLL
jgi:cardiolipin synthase